MAAFKVVTGMMSGPLADLGGANYEMEREALEPIGAEIVVLDASNEDAFIEQAKDADAIIGRGVRLTPKVLEALQKCKVIAGSGVGFDYVDVPAATRAGIVVTNVPDVFIEEVADHAMTLLLASWRRLITQDRIVREGQWGEGRQELSKYARLQGQALGFVSFGNIPRLITKRAKAFGLRVLAFDPFIHEHVMQQHDVGRNGQSARAVASVRLCVHARTAVPCHAGDVHGAAIPRHEADGHFPQHRARSYGGRKGTDTSASGRLDRRRRT